MRWLICFVFLGLGGLHAWAATEGMRDMPKITPSKTTTVKTKEEGEALLRGRGFGAEEPKVRMMNLMMVEGSGMEGMDMSAPAGGAAHGQSHEHSHEHSHGP